MTETPPATNIVATPSGEEKHAPAATENPRAAYAAQSLKSIGETMLPELKLVDMIEILRTPTQNDAAGESLMFNQAQVLDSLFHRMTITAMQGHDEQNALVRDYVTNKRLDIVLRAQKQCRSTLQAILGLRR